MIRHVVLFKFYQGITWDDPRAVSAEAATRQHPAHIPEILAWECGRNHANRSIAYDFALIGTFRDEMAVDRYLTHPDHLRGVGLWREIADWRVVDFRVPARDTGEPKAADGDH